MAVYHFAWDLSFFSLADFGVTENPLWIAFARAIAGSFLALVGVGLYLAHGDGVRWPGFLRRVAVIAFWALAISVASYLADPDGVILFGILHCIAVSSVIGLLFLRAPLALVIAAAIACLAAPSFLTSPAFNGLGWVWLGLGSEVRPSNDYNPLLPWFGMVLSGIAIARIVPRDKWPALAATRHRHAHARADRPAQSAVLSSASARLTRYTLGGREGDRLTAIA